MPIRYHRNRSPVRRRLTDKWCHSGCPFKLQGAVHVSTVGRSVVRHLLEAICDDESARLLRDVLMGLSLDVHIFEQRQSCVQTIMQGINLVGIIRIIVEHSLERLVL